MRFGCERVTIEPFDLRQPVKYDVVIDRLTHWYSTSREWIKKAIMVDDLYVFNNPWSVQSMEKHTSYAAMMRLGLPVPETWIVPPKAYEASDDLEPTLGRYAKMFDLERRREGRVSAVHEALRRWGWVGVTKIDDASALQSLRFERHGADAPQSAVRDDLFVRIVGVGPQTR